MIHEVKSYSLCCDNCGESYQDDHSGFSIFTESNQAFEHAENDGWYLHGQDASYPDEHFCPECFKFDQDVDDKIHVDLSRKKILPAPPPNKSGESDAVGFAEWASDKGWQFKRHGNVWQHSFTYEFKTSSELYQIYQLYLKSLNG